MINENYPHSVLTSQIIGCGMEVHNVLGNYQGRRRYRNRSSITVLFDTDSNSSPEMKPVHCVMK